MNKTDFIERVVQRLAEGKLRGMLGGLAQYHHQSTGEKPTISKLKGMARGGMKAFSDIANRAQGRQVLGQKPKARDLSPEAQKGMDITYPQKDAPAKGARLVKPTLSLRQRAERAGQQRPGAVVTKTPTGTVTEVPSRNPRKLPTLIAGGRRGSPTISKPGIRGGELTREDASHQFIDRTVGILVDRIEELRQSTMKSAARQARAKAKALTKASGAAREGGAGGAASTLAIAAGGRTAQADRISQGAKARASGTPRTKPSQRGGRGAIAASNQETRAARQELASHQNFIGKTVEILAEKLIGNQPEIDANGDKKITKKDFKILRKREDEAVKPDTSAYLAPSKPQNTPIDGRGIPKTPKEIAQQQAKDKAFSDKFRADIAKKFGR